MFRIRSIDALNIKANARFSYRGYTVSMSTIFTPATVAFWPRGCMESSVFTEADSVEDAINAINKLVEAEAETA